MVAPPPTRTSAKARRSRQVATSPVARRSTGSSGGGSHEGRNARTGRCLSRRSSRIIPGVSTIKTDYLIVGAGAAGMAFADELIARCDADIVLVDRRVRPGGHWNDGYPFLRLHQPSAFYGVNSLPLGNDSIDTTGPHAGFYERATAVEVCDYYRNVLEQRLLPTGQVEFYGPCDYIGDWSREHAFRSRLTGGITQVRVRRKIVDATYLESSVPATHAPGFEIDPEVDFVPVGRLPSVADSPSGYTILGAGKTAMDACNWLLGNGVDPDMIRWIRPRDAWVMDPAAFQPLDLLAGTIELFSLVVEALAESDSVADLLARVEHCGFLCRLDTTLEPTMFRGAILSRAERESLQQIERVVRLGRVRRLGIERIVLDHGTVPTRRGELYVDCTADGLPVAAARPIFGPGRITIQALVAGQTSPSAATIAFVESAWSDEGTKNRLCRPSSNPTITIDFVRMMQKVLRDFAVRLAEPDLTAWWDTARVNLTRGLGACMDDPRVQAAMGRWAASMEPALERAERFLHPAPETVRA